MQASERRSYAEQPDSCVMPIEAALSRRRDALLAQPVRPQAGLPQQQVRTALAVCARNGRPCCWRAFSAVKYASSET